MTDTTGATEQVTGRTMSDAEVRKMYEKLTLAAAQSRIPGVFPSAWEGEAVSPIRTTLTNTTHPIRR